MSKFSSMIQVFTVENEEKTSARTGNKYTHFAARCALLDDSGQIVNVGALRVPPAMRDQVKVGAFRAGFALQVPDWGDQKGDIVAVLTDLTPIQTRGAAPAPAAKAA